MDVLALIGAALADAAFAFVACIGFALISNPPVKICLVAGVLAGLGHMTRFLLLDEGVGIVGIGLLKGVFPPRGADVYRGLKALDDARGHFL